MSCKLLFISLNLEKLQAYEKEYIWRFSNPSNNNDNTYKYVTKWLVTDDVTESRLKLVPTRYNFATSIMSPTMTEIPDWLI
ncbi:hypothetical protein YC2023_119123 [Brassica napus]